MALPYVHSVKRSWYTYGIREEKEQYDEVHQPHDKGYKYILSKSENFLELLQSFIAEDWVKQIEVGQIERLDKSFILPDFKNQEADQLYRLQLNGQELFSYVLLELQSTVDFQMPFRLLQYMAEVWRDYVKEAGRDSRRKHFRLPTIIPIVLYTGKGSWTAVRNFKSLLDGQERFSEGILDFRYILIDINGYTEHQLLEMNNLIGSVMLLDQTVRITEFIRRLIQLAPTMRSWDEHKFRMFNTWVAGNMIQQLPVESRSEVQGIFEKYKPTEVDRMLTNLERTIRNGMLEAKEEGLLEGKLEGKLEVAKAMLHEGMPLETIARITGLEKETLDKELPR